MLHERHFDGRKQTREAERAPLRCRGAAALLRRRAPLSHRPKVQVFGNSSGTREWKRRAFGHLPVSRREEYDLRVSDEFEVLIREASALDAAAIARVHLESSNDAYAPLARSWPPPDPVARTAHWTQLLLAPQRVTLVAVKRGDLVAFASGGPARRSGLDALLEVHVIHVLPEHRANGLGSRLWSAICTQLRGVNLAPIYVETLAELRCCSFYEAHGGRLAQQKKAKFHGGDVTEIVYRWPEGVLSDFTR